MGVECSMVNNGFFIRSDIPASGEAIAVIGSLKRIVLRTISGIDWDYAFFVQSTIQALSTLHKKIVDVFCRCLYNSYSGHQ